MAMEVCMYTPFQMEWETAMQLKKYVGIWHGLPKGLTEVARRVKIDGKNRWTEFLYIGNNGVFFVDQASGYWNTAVKLSEYYHRWKELPFGLTEVARRERVSTIEKGFKWTEVLYVDNDNEFYVDYLFDKNM